VVLSKGGARGTFRRNMCHREEQFGYYLLR
jgi:hypothetical protein